MFSTALYTIVTVLGSCWAYRDLTCFRSGVDWVLDKIDPTDVFDGKTERVEKKDEKPSDTDTEGGK